MKNKTKDDLKIASIVEIGKVDDDWIAMFKGDKDNDKPDYFFAHPHKKFLLKFVDDIIKKSMGKDLVNNPIHDKYPNLDIELENLKFDKQIKVWVNPEFERKHEVWEKSQNFMRL